METGARISGEKAPKLKNLDQWLSTHRKYNIDIYALAALQPTSSLSNSLNSGNFSSKEAKDIIKQTPASTSSTQKAVKPSAKPTKKVELKQSLDAVENAGTLMGAALDANQIPVFYKSTGIALPADKWPTLSNICNWLDKNPDCNVQSTYGIILKVHF